MACLPGVVTLTSNFLAADRVLWRPEDLARLQVPLALRPGALQKTVSLQVGEEFLCLFIRFCTQVACPTIPIRHREGLGFAQQIPQLPG